MKKIVHYFLPSISLMLLIGALFFTTNSFALSVQDGAEAARADGMPAELIGVDGVFTKITNTILYIIGIISVIMLIYGGLRYVISSGDKTKVTEAKNTILYAIIGLIISLLAFAIVNFVINTVSSDYTNSSSETSETSE